jgi:PAS domain S-box-containing protein
LKIPSTRQWEQANEALQKEVNERRALELELRIREANYRETAKLLDLTHDAIVVCNLRNEILFWNKAAESLYGWLKEEAEGKVLHDLLQTVFPKSLPAINAEILEKGYWEGELLHRRRDGAVLTISSRWALRKNDDGTPAAILKSNRDITRQKQEQEKFRNLLETAPDAMVIVNDKGEIQLVNTQTEKLFGYAREELLGKPVEILVPERFHGRHGAHRTRYAKSPVTRGMGAGLELYGRRRDGTEFPVEISLSPLEMPEGTLVSSAIRDVTERKRTLDALQLSEERLKLAIEAAQFGVWDLDVISDQAFRSPRHDQIFGYESLQTEWGIEIAERHIVPEDRERFRVSFAEAFKSNDFYVECRINRAADHSLRWICAQGRVYRDPAGKPVRMMGVVSDVTERKEALQELERHRLELSRSNSGLAAANKELEAFSYSVSHDLRAPLRTIDGFSHALLEDCSDKLDDASKSHLNRIRAATQRMGMLIDDLLNLSRLSRTTMHVQNVDISGMARNIADDLQKSDPGRQIALRIEDDLTATADPGLLRAVLENLLNNAWKFTSKRPFAHIEFGQTQGNGTTAFFVRDDGAGFDPAYADRLFGAFQRLHSTNEFAGTGVGLATVQRIINRHGGRIWAESAVGKGATFYFTLGENTVQGVRDEKQLDYAGRR